MKKALVLLALILILSTNTAKAAGTYQVQQPVFITINGILINPNTISRIVKGRDNEIWVYFMASNGNALTDRIRFEFKDLITRDQVYANIVKKFSLHAY